MAFITNVCCTVCGETKNEITDNSGVCQECRGKIESATRRAYLAGLKGLTVEERLEKLEAQFFDLKINQRLSILESYNAVC